jgi:cholesterol transport system auxiliary component
MRRRAALAALGSVAALPACTLLGADRPSPTFFVLRDPGTATAAERPLPRTLLVAPSATSPFYDSQSIVFSRAPGTRAYYQFAAWTERPGKRLDTLLMARFERRNAFAAVASSTAGVRGDLLLAATLEELYHDDQRAPGNARIVLSAELTDRNDRRLVGRRSFTAEVAVREDNAEGAVRAFETGVARILDELVTWVESAAAAA